MTGQFQACLTVTLVFKFLYSPRMVPVYATKVRRGDPSYQYWLSEHYWQAARVFRVGLGWF